MKQDNIEIKELTDILGEALGKPSANIRKNAVYRWKMEERYSKYEKVYNSITYNGVLR